MPAPLQGSIAGAQIAQEAALTTRLAVMLSAASALLATEDVLTQAERLKLGLVEGARSPVVPQQQKGERPLPAAAVEAASHSMPTMPTMPV